MRILVTNDDGVRAPGLASVARALRGDGHTVVVAAPLTDWSGMGAALGPVHVNGCVDYERLEIDGLAGCEVVGVDGPPALAVVLGCLRAFGPRPDLVVSGINAGPNVGHAVLHSGTVGAALTALSFGVPGLAISVAAPSRGYHGAAGLARSLAAKAVRRGAPAVLNVNAPDWPTPEWRGVRLASLAQAGLIEARVAEAGLAEAGSGSVRLWLAPAETDDADGPGVEADTDLALLTDGWVTVTPLTGIGQDAHAGYVGVEDARVPAAAVRGGAG